MAETQDVKAMVVLIKEGMDPEIKMEEEEESESAITEPGDVKEGAVLLKAKVKQEPEEGPSGNWDAQLQGFLMGLQAHPLSGGTPQLPELMQCNDPTIGATVFNKWPRELWVSQIQPQGTGEIQESPTHSGKREERVLAGETVGSETQHEQFRSLRYQEADGPRKFCQRLQELCRQWLKPESHTKEEMLELVTLEQFLAVLPPDMQTWLRKNGPETCAQAVTLAEDFLLWQPEAKVWEGQGTAVTDEDLVNFSQANQAQTDVVKIQIPTEAKQESEESASVLADGGWMEESEEEKKPILEHPEQMELPVMLLKTGQEPDESPYQPEKQNGGDKDEGEGQLVCKTENEPNIQEVQNVKYEECDESFGLNYQLTMHNSPHGEKKSYQCWHCGQSFSSSSDLLSHERNHVAEKLYTCSNCGESERIHMGQKPHKCSVCGNTFGLNTQQEKQQRKKIHVCPICGKAYTEISSFLQHQGLHRGEEEKKPILEHPEQMELPVMLLKTDQEPDESPYKPEKQNGGDEEEGESQLVCSQVVCKTENEPNIEEVQNVKYEECDESFGLSSHLTVHNSPHGEKKPYQCWHCGQSFSSSSDLLSHERNHVGEKLYTCSNCGESERIHMGQKPHKCSVCGNTFGCNTQQEKQKRKKIHVCPICGKAYMKITSFLQHQGLHRGEKPYKCSKCAENFGTYTSLKVHRRTHTGENQYKCSYCGMCFSCSPHLRAHERTHMAMCSYCGKSFNKKSELIEHERTHSRGDSLACFVCGKTFEVISELVFHVRTHTDKPPECSDSREIFQCSQCGDTFSHGSALRVHQRIHTGEKI